MRGIVNTILKLPNAQKLIATIQKEGPIRIAIRNTGLSNQFGAFWDRQDRVIGISFSQGSQLQQGKIIGSIIFELQNALTNSKMDHFDHLASSRQIGKEEYVEAMEHLEFQNSKNASRLVEEGIQERAFSHHGAAAHLSQL